MPVIFVQILVDSSISFTGDVITPAVNELEKGEFVAVYYQNADIEFSLKLRQTGGRLLQMSLPLEQGRHHAYFVADPEYREVQANKNYDRLLERFKGKSAILSPRR